MTKLLLDLPHELLEEILSYIYTKLDYDEDDLEDKYLTNLNGENLKDSFSALATSKTFLNIFMYASDRHQFRKLYYAISTRSNDNFIEIEKLPCRSRTVIDSDDCETVASVIYSTFAKKDENDICMACYSPEEYGEETLHIYFDPYSLLSKKIKIFSKLCIGQYVPSVYYKFSYTCKINAELDCKNKTIKIKSYTYDHYFRNPKYTTNCIDVTDLEVKSQAHYDRYLYAINGLKNVFDYYYDNLTIDESEIKFNSLFAKS